MPFRDRGEAGRRLALRLRRWRKDELVVLALPRGGAVVGYEVARALKAPLGLVLTRRLGAPGRPELTIGAIAQRGIRLVDQLAVRLLSVSDDVVCAAEEQAKAELERLRQLPGSGDCLHAVKGRTVILVDDGLASGMTARAAVRFLRQLGPRRIVLAVPVGAPWAIEVVRPYVEELICLTTPSAFRAVSLSYQDFREVSLDAVAAILEACPDRGAAQRSSGAGEGVGRRPTSVGPDEASGRARLGRRRVFIPAGAVELASSLTAPRNARGIVLLAHGGGSSRLSPREGFLAAYLNRAGFTTLRVDLLTPEEDAIDRCTEHIRFDISLLAERLLWAARWVAQDAATRGLPLGYLGTSTGAAAACVAAAREPRAVRAIVARAGRLDLAGHALPGVAAPTLLVVGGKDVPVLGVNRKALRRLGADHKELATVPEAAHLFEEPGALERAAELASDWFSRWLGPEVARSPCA